MRTIPEYTNSQIKRYWNKRISKEELEKNIEDYTIYYIRKTSNKGRKSKTILGKFKNFKTKAKKINQYDLDGNFIRTFLSINSAGNETKISKGNICSCCKGSLKKTGGYIWKYFNI